VDKNHQQQPSSSFNSSSIAFLRIPSFDIIYEFTDVTEKCQLVAAPLLDAGDDDHENNNADEDDGSTTILWYSDVEQG
jgi:hypothetical protein